MGTPQPTGTEKKEQISILLRLQNRSERTNDYATDTEHTRTRNTTHGTDDCKWSMILLCADGSDDGDNNNNNTDRQRHAHTSAREPARTVAPARTHTHTSARGKRARTDGRRPTYDDDDDCDDDIKRIQRPRPNGSVSRFVANGSNGGWEGGGVHVVDVDADSRRSPGTKINNNNIVARRRK